MLTALGLDGYPEGRTTVGEGAVINLTSLDGIDGLAGALSEYAFTLDPAAEVEVLPWVTEGGDLLVYVCSEAPLPDDLAVRAPGGMAGQAIVCSADKPEPTVVALDR